MDQSQVVATQRDQIVIIWSEEDQAFIGHSLLFDQIGMGETEIVAFADCIRAVIQVKKLASRRGGIVFQKAPQEIWDLAKSGRRLPDEINRIAWLMAHDQWPEMLKAPEFTTHVEVPLIGEPEEEHVAL